MGGMTIIGAATAGGLAVTKSVRSSSETRQARYFAPGVGSRFDITTANQPSVELVFSSRSSTLTCRRCASKVSSSSDGMIPATSDALASTVSQVIPAGGSSRL
jgi:hypothetical protein